MIIKDGEDFLRMDLKERTPIGIQGEGDVEFSIEVHVSNPMQTFFHGKSWAWVEASELRSFAAVLKDIERTRKGSASMRAMSPNEFQLTIQVYDALGHVAAFGKLAHWCYGPTDGNGWSEINFILSVDPSDLLRLAQEFSEYANEQPNKAL